MNSDLRKAGDILRLVSSWKRLETIFRTLTAVRMGKCILNSS